MKVRDIHKIEKRNCINISVFVYQNKEKYLIYVLNNAFKRHVDLLLLGRKAKRQYIHVKESNMSMYDHIPRCGKKSFFHYCLQVFGTLEILKSHVNDCFKINGKQMIKVPKNGEYVRFKSSERKIKSPYLIYADVENILMLGNNGKQNPGKSYANKYR